MPQTNGKKKDVRSPFEKYDRLTPYEKCLSWIYYQYIITKKNTDYLFLTIGLDSGTLVNEIFFLIDGQSMVRIFHKNNITTGL